MRRRLGSIAVLVTFGLVGVACGDDGGSADTTTAPSTTTADGPLLADGFEVPALAQRRATGTPLAETAAASVDGRVAVQRSMVPATRTDTREGRIWIGGLAHTRYLSVMPRGHRTDVLRVRSVGHRSA